MTATQLVFPVLCLGPDVGRYAVEGREILDWHQRGGFLDLHVMGPETWRAPGMLLADNAGRFWRIVRVENLGVVGGFWMRVLRFLLQQSVHRISQEIVEDTPLSFANLLALQAIPMLFATMKRSPAKMVRRAMNWRCSTN